MKLRSYPISNLFHGLPGHAIHTTKGTFQVPFGLSGRFPLDELIHPATPRTAERGQLERQAGRTPRG